MKVKVGDRVRMHPERFGLGISNYLGVCIGIVSNAHGADSYNIKWDDDHGTWEYLEDCFIVLHEPVDILKEMINK